MSSFLSAAENFARQRQNVRRDLKKKMEEESRAVKLAFESHICLFLVSIVQGNVSIAVGQLYLYIWYHRDAVDARECSQFVVDDALGMTSLAAR